VVATDRISGATGRTIDLAAAVSDFADVLRELRAAAGTPSFREMAARSKAISHTTLHEAVCGSRLPSWPTTVEFVKACDADPADYRERWKEVNRATRAAAGERRHREPVAADPGAVVAPEVAVPRVVVPDGLLPNGLAPDAREPEALAAELLPAEVLASEMLEPESIRRRTGRSRWLRLSVAGVAALIVVAMGGIVLWGIRNPSSAGPTTPVAKRQASDCPIQQQNPPYMRPVHPGDVVAFVGDMTLPDCSHVAPGARVIKDWRFKNQGTVPWVGYTLRRIDLPQQPNQCQTIIDIPIADTAPGKFVDVAVEVTAPRKPAFCFIRFKMMDADGRVAFPGNRPVNLQLIVR